MSDVERLAELFAYEGVSGMLIWRRRPLHHFADERACTSWNRRFAGSVAGRVVGGYVRVRVGKEQLLAHRVVFALTTGALPEGEIDHVDGDPLNNRFTNLREVSRLENARNRKLNRNNTTGVSGLEYVRKTGRWAASIGAGARKRRRIGTFATREEAIAARRQHEELLGYGERAR